MTTVANTPAATQELQLLVFNVRGEECAVPLTDTREIITAMALTPVPAAPPSIRGMVNIRGRVVTVVDLAVVLGLTGEAKGQHIVVAERGSDVFGVLVDTVTGVLRVGADSMQHAPDLVQAKPAARFVKGVVVLSHGALEKAKNNDSQPKENAKTETSNESRLIVMLDLPGLLDDVGRSNHASTASPVQP